jgi:hypothetical protein
LESAFVAALPKPRKTGLKQSEWAKSLERFNIDAKAIRSKHKLGVVGRAVVAYRLQKRLIERGYPADVVRQLLFAMILNAFVG